MEFIVKRQKDFEILRTYASYASELTKVIAISDKTVPSLPENVKKVIEKYENIKDLEIDASVPLITSSTKGGKLRLFIENSDDLINLFLGVNYTGEIGRESFVRMLELLSLNLVRLDNETLKILSTDLDISDPIDKLFSSNFTTNYKHKRVSLNDFGDTIADLKLLDKSIREISATKYQVIKDLIIESFDNLTKIATARKGDVVYEIRFFYVPEASKSYLVKGNCVNLMTEKVYGNYKKIIMDPEIVPRNFPDTFVRNKIKSSKRDIPSKLLNVAFAELFYRERRN